MKKKLIALMVMLAMVFCLAACGGGASEPAEPEEAEPAEEAEETAPAAAPEDIVVDEEAGTVTITGRFHSGAAGSYTLRIYDSLFDQP